MDSLYPKDLTIANLMRLTVIKPKIDKLVPMFYNKVISAPTICKIPEILDRGGVLLSLSKISEFSCLRLKVERSEDVADGE